MTELPAGKVVEEYPYGFGGLSAAGFKELVADRPGVRVRPSSGCGRRGFVYAGRRERKGMLRCCICVETCLSVAVMERSFSAP